MQNVPKWSDTLQGISCIKGLKVATYRNPNPAGNYLSKVNNRNSRTRCDNNFNNKVNNNDNSVVIINFEHISHLALVFLLLSLSR